MTRQTHSRTDNQSGVHQEKHSLQTKDSDYGPIKPPLLKTCFSKPRPPFPAELQRAQHGRKRGEPKVLEEALLLTGLALAAIHHGFDGAGIFLLRSIRFLPGFFALRSTVLL